MVPHISIYSFIYTHIISSQYKWSLTPLGIPFEIEQLPTSQNTLPVDPSKCPETLNVAGA